MTTWREVALGRIERIHKKMNEGMGEPVSADELRRELRRHSGSFSQGTSWGGKVWPKACREYLVGKFGQPAAVKQKRVEDSPLFKPEDHAFPFRNA